MNTNTLSEFLGFTTSQKEVSLMIAKDADEQTAFQDQLEANGFEEAKSMADILDKVQKPTKLFIVLHTNFTKHLYDFMIQYPTGQIELSHLHQMDTRVISPHYIGSSVIFLTTIDHVEQYFRDGFDIKSHTGLTYQS